MKQSGKNRIVGLLMWLLLVVLLSTTAFAAKNEVSLNKTDSVVGESFQAVNMFPGDHVTQDYEVTVSHHEPVEIYFEADIRTGYEKLAEVLKLQVHLPEKNVTLYDGLMCDMPDQIAVLPAGENSLTYRLTAYLDTSVGNDYQAKELVADFRWWYMPVNSGGGEGPGGGDDWGGDYEPEGPEPVRIKLAAEKLLDGKAPESRKYMFTLTDEDGRLLQRIYNKDGLVDFYPFFLEQAGTYIYYMREVAGTDPDIIYDDTVYKIIVTVKEENDVLTANLAYEQDGQPYQLLPRFINTTKGTILPPDPSGPETVHIKLVAEVFLDGKYPEDDLFSFVLCDQFGAILQIVKNDGGMVEFDHIVLSTLGTHTFYIRELTGPDLNIFYDVSKYEIAVTITVTEEGGRYVAAVSIERNGKPYSRIPQFFNFTKPGPGVPETGDLAPVRVKLMAEKVLDDRYPRGNDFSFTLCNRYGVVLQTVKNNDGVVEFDSFGLTRTGTYIYYIRELTGTDDDIRYDVSKYKVIVTVIEKDDALVAQVTYEKDGMPYDALPRFHNTTKGWNTPNDPLSPEGDSSDAPVNPDNPKNDEVTICPWCWVFCLVLAVLATVLYLRHRFVSASILMLAAIILFMTGCKSIFGFILLPGTLIIWIIGRVKGVPGL